jgi:MoaA/NifB/PqqE/SkfB family radical SAM enzyme
VAGGEPSIMPEFRKFLKRAVEAGRTDIEIRMNTNATNINQEYRDLLSNFSNLHITVSVDAYDQINRYIRWPSDWSAIVENVDGLYQITKNISFNVTVSIWNISNLSQLVLFLEQRWPWCTILLNKVTYPAQQVFTTFPNKQLALADLQLLTQTRTYQQDPSFKTKTNYYIAEMEKSELDIVALTQFFKYNDALDISRNVRLADYIPELEQCRDLITKPI